MIRQLPKRPQDIFPMLDVDDVARLLNCSGRHVYRLVDSGLMPRPVKIGALNRWSKQAVGEWIANGCQPCREGA